MGEGPPAYQVFYGALELANLLQGLLVPFHFIDVHGQVLEIKTGSVHQVTGGELPAPS